MTDTPDISPNLGLPFYQTKQNEFEVQHNEALLMLDALVMLAVIDRDLSAPPLSPDYGDRYLVKPTGTGAFAGQDNRIAQYDSGGWNFYAPQVGWTCYVQDEYALLAWDGDSWEPALHVMTGLSELQNLSRLGVGTTADATNPLAAKLNNTLWTAKTVAEGGDGHLRAKLSKESAGKTLSLLFQDNYSGRAEIGLTGDDDLHFKVSADGSTWREAILIDRSTGAVSLPQTAVLRDLDIVLAELALGLADALNVAQFLGLSGNRFADSFDALTYVNTGGASNLDSGTAGQLKPAVTTQLSTGAAIGDMTGGGGNAAAFDGTTSQAHSAGARKDAATLAYVGQDYSAGPKAIASATVFGSNNNGYVESSNPAVTVTLRGKNGSPPSSAGDGTALGTITFTDTSDEHVGRSIASNDLLTAWDYVWTAVSQGGSANNIYVAELQLFGPGALAVTSTSLTAAAAPATMKAVAMVEFSYATINTDLILSVSRDGGTTWTAATLIDRFTANSIHVLESNAIDVSGQPSGTAGRWKIATANNRMVKVHGIYLYWS